jgi:chaperonin GroES
MQPRLIKTQHAEYRPGVYAGKNESGWTPIGDKVLVLTDQPAEQTTGGVWITEDTKDRMSMAAETGIVVALGHSAFLWNADRSRPLTGPRPGPGDFVYIERYAGQVIMGNDGQIYRLMSDACIAAINHKDKE